MRIACPACGAAYEVPDRLIGAAGRQLRCAKCGHAWLARPVDAAPGAVAPDLAGPGPTLPASLPPIALAPGPELLPDPGPVRSLPPPLVGPRRAAQVIDPPLPQHDDAPPRPMIALWAAWAASILLVILAGVALWAWRADIVGAWPPMARLYLALGIDPGG